MIMGERVNRKPDRENDKALKSCEISQNMFDQNEFAKQLSIKLSVHPSYLEGSEFQNQVFGAGIAKVCF